MLFRSVAIPLPNGAREGQTGVRSLNLSVAVGVVLFEAIRQLSEPRGASMGSSCREC